MDILNKVNGANTVVDSYDDMYIAFTRLLIVLIANTQLYCSFAMMNEKEKPVTSFSATLVFRVRHVEEITVSSV